MVLYGAVPADWANDVVDIFLMHEAAHASTDMQVFLMNLRYEYKQVQDADGCYSGRAAVPNPGEDAAFTMALWFFSSTRALIYSMELSS